MFLLTGIRLKIMLTMYKRNVPGNCTWLYRRHCFERSSLRVTRWRRKFALLIISLIFVLAVTLMGLDIHIATDNYEEIYTIDYYKSETDFRNKMSLSREFCNLMCRRHVSTGTPEFEQVAKLANVNLT